MKSKEMYLLLSVSLPVYHFFFSLLRSVVVIRSSSWLSDQFYRSNWFAVLMSVMVDHLPPVLLEACVVVGASDDKLRDVYQVFAFKCTLTQTIKVNHKAVRHVEPFSSICPVCVSKKQNAPKSTIYYVFLLCLNHQETPSLALNKCAMGNTVTIGPDSKNNACIMP